MSLRDQIINSSDIESELLEVPAWDATVEIRTMDARTRLRMMAVLAADSDGSVNLEMMYPDIIIACTFDPTTGERIFTSEDRDVILSKASGSVDLVANAAIRLSGMGGDSMDEAGKGSSSTPSEDSPLS